jgi:hypothetical protein
MPRIALAFFRAIVAPAWLGGVATAIFLLVVMTSCGNPDSRTPNAANKSGMSEVENEYEQIRSAIGPDPAANLTPWGMTYDHIFSSESYGEPGTEEALRQRCRRFVRRDGALDLLFSKLMDQAISDTEVLGITQILLFWGMDDEEGDGRLHSHRANDFIRYINSNGLVHAEMKYPDFAIRKYLLTAAKKAV